MDPKLAEIYGTNQPDEADVEKLAAAELAEKLAAEDEVNTDGLSDDDYEALASEVLGEGTGDEQPAEETEVETQGADEGEEKVAEADYLGRVMAHAYAQELRGIEKDAGRMDAAKAGLKKGMHGAGRVMESIGKKLTPKKLSDKAFTSGKKGAFKKDLAAGKSPGHIQKKEKHTHYGTSAGASREGNLHKGVGAAATGAAAAAGGYGAKKALEKKSSALDTLVEKRALEILADSGIDPASLQQVEQEKVSAPSNPAEALASRVEQGAWDLLAQFGVEPAPAEQAEE